MRSGGRGLGLCLAAALFACGRQEPRAGLVVALPAGPVSDAPNAYNEEITNSILSNVYETLATVDPNLSLQPALAESWHSPDDLTWVFTLRRGVRLHDGRDLQATDVAASLEHARTSPASRRRNQLGFVTSIEATDRRTVVIRTRQPTEPLPLRLSTVVVWARAKRPGDPPVGTGPYRFRSFTVGGDVELEAFQDHWQGPPPVASARFVVVPDASERVRRLRQGKVDLVLDVPAEAIPRLRSDPSLRFATRAGLRVLFLAMDYSREKSPWVRTAKNPFLDKRVREAVALAIDREGLVRGPLRGTAQRVEEIVSPEEHGGDKDKLFPRAHDPARAKALLADAGYAQGFSVTLDYIAKKYRAIDEVAKAVAHDLGAVGIKVALRPGSVSEIIGRVESRDTSFYLLGYTNATGDASLSYEYLLHTPGNGYGLDNGGGYSNPELDGLLARALATRVPEESRALFSHMARLVYDDIPVVPLYRQDDLFAYSARIAFTPRLDRRIRVADVRVAPEAR